jgi:hypothetical protein
MNNNLEKYYNNKTQGSVCIKYNNGKIERVKVGVAHLKVIKGVAKYCSKEEWKKSRGVQKKKEEVAPVETPKSENTKVSKRGKNSKKD